MPGRGDVVHPAGRLARSLPDSSRLRRLRAQTSLEPRRSPRRSGRTVESGEMGERNQHRPILSLMTSRDAGWQGPRRAAWCRGQGSCRSGRTETPEGTGGDLRSTGPEAANKSAVLGRRRVPRSQALRPANLVPGTVPRIAPRTGLAVQPAPSGKKKCTAGRYPATTGLSTKLHPGYRKLSPNFPAMWTVCGYTRVREVSDPWVV
jgi:hypothetical protein